jgi:hypothetical protein
MKFGTNFSRCFPTINSRWVPEIAIVALVCGFSPIVIYSQEQENDSEWKVGGDLRLRHESSASGDGEPSRHRECIRFRIGTERTISDSLSAALRLRTGDPSNARSPYHDLSDGFDSLDLGLDRLFLRWSTSGTTRVMVGKLPLEQTELLPYGELVCVFGYFGWNDVSPGGDFDTLGLSNRGNQLNGSDTDFRSDFRILRLASSWSGTLGGWRVTLADEWIRNLGADVEHDAFAMGVSAEPSEGSTQFFHQWQTVDEDAVLTPVSQDDFLHGSGFRGHVFGCKRSLGETVSLRCWGLVSKDRRLVAADDRGRFRLDLDFKF